MRRTAAGKPEDSGVSLETVRQLGPDFPLFGVCMGHQCIGQVFGGNVVRAPSGVMHGKSSPVFHKDTGTLKVGPTPVAFTFRGCFLPHDRSHLGCHIGVAICNITDLLLFASFSCQIHPSWERYCPRRGQE